MLYNLMTEQLESVDSAGRTSLHNACEDGRKEEVLRLLAEMQHCGILKEGLFRHDATGRNALNLAQAQKKQEWNEHLHGVSQSLIVKSTFICLAIKLQQ